MKSGDVYVNKEGVWFTIYSVDEKGRASIYYEDDKSSPFGHYTKKRLNECGFFKQEKPKEIEWI